MSLTFKQAESKDMAALLFLIKELASYEHLEQEVTATEEILTEWIFTKKKAEVIFPVLDGKIIGYCLYFYNFSTFLGKAGIYVEDLFIQPAFRHKGYGRKLLQHIARKAKNEGLGEWSGLALTGINPALIFTFL